MDKKWNRLELKDYIEKLQSNESLFRREFLCEFISKYCHDFGKRHYFIRNKCEICGIRYNKFRDLMERRGE